MLKSPFIFTAHGKPRLAMSFPAKENQKPKQTNLAESLNSVSDDYLSNFFVQPKTTPNDHDRKSKKTPGLKVRIVCTSLC